MTLYEINENYLTLLTAIENGDIPEEAITDTLQAVEGELTDKLDNYACFIKSLKSEARAIKAEIDSLTDRMKAKQNKADKLSQAVFEILKSADKRKIETSRNVISIPKARKSVEITDNDKFIEWAKIHRDDLLNYKEPTVKRKEIGDILKAGGELPFAVLSEKETLNIK